MCALLNSKKSFQARINRMGFWVGFAFILIAICLILASFQLRKNVDRTIESGLKQVVSSSKNNRDFGLFSARLSILKATFDLDGNWYATERNGVLEDLSNVYVAVNDTAIKGAIGQLQSELNSYLEGRELANSLLFWRIDEDLALKERLVRLKEAINQKKIALASSDDEKLYLEQLSLLAPDLIDIFVKVTNLNLAENPAQLLFSDLNALTQREIELANLKIRLRTIIAAEPPIDRLGQGLVDSINQYQEKLKRYQEVMVHLGELGLGLNDRSAQILSSMDNLAQKFTATVKDTKDKADAIIFAIAISALGSLLLVAIIVWLYVCNFFKKNVQEPLDMVRERLEKFEQGDVDSPMSLDRYDEWNEVEVTFNQMATNLKESVTSLEKSEQRYRNIFDSASDGIFRITVSGNVIDINRAIIEMFGYDLPVEGEAVAGCERYSDILQSSIYCRSEDRERWIDLLERHQDVHNFEVELRRIDGTTFWASLSGHLVAGDDTQEAYIDGIIRNVSEHKKARDEMQQLQHYLQDIIDSMPSILIGVDNNMKVTLWNQRAADESLLAADDAKGYAMSTVCYLFDFSSFMPKLEETLETGKPIWLPKVESNKKSSSGGQRFFDILIFPLSMKGADGAVIYMDEVTEKLQLEEMMVQSEKMQSIGGLAAGLAHEINNPLAVILQNIQVLERRYSPSLKKNHQVAEDLNITMEAIIEYNKVRGCEQIIHSIAEAGHRVAKIVTNIQSFSRSGTYSLVPCPITDLLERTIELAASDYDMRNSYNFKNISIIRNFQPVPDVCCESSQVQQVLLSLLKNAAQALTESSDNQQITLDIAQVDDLNVRISISDNGKGIEPDVVEHIFDPFYTTQDVGAGFGLGLSTAYFIVTHNHGGRLRVVSELGIGSCFEVVLPIDSVSDGETII